MIRRSLLTNRMFFLAWEWDHQRKNLLLHRLHLDKEHFCLWRLKCCCSRRMQFLSHGPASAGCSCSLALTRRHWSHSDWSRCWSSKKEGGTGLRGDKLLRYDKQQPPQQCVCMWSMCGCVSECVHACVWPSAAGTAVQSYAFYLQLPDMGNFQMAKCQRRRSHCFFPSLLTENALLCLPRYSAMLAFINSVLFPSYVTAA